MSRNTSCTWIIKFNITNYPLNNTQSNSYHQVHWHKSIRRKSILKRKFTGLSCFYPTKFTLCHTLNRYAYLQQQKTPLWLYSPPYEFSNWPLGELGLGTQLELKFHDCTPNIVWRHKRILHNISVTSDLDFSIKSTPSTSQRTRDPQPMKPSRELISKSKALATSPNPALWLVRRPAARTEMPTLLSKQLNSSRTRRVNKPRSRLARHIHPPKELETCIERH